MFGSIYRQAFVGLSAGMASTVAFSTVNGSIQAESKRRFYEDLDDQAVILGTNSAISKELFEKETLNSNKDIDTSYANGMSIRTSHFLENKLNNLRKWSINNLDYYFYEYQTAKSSLNNEWNAVSNKYHAIVVEPVLPNLIYILTGALSGSVLVNRRVLPIRFITPLVFGTSLFGYLMPKSFNNTREWAWKIEKENFPQLAHQHLQVLIAVQENKRLAYKKLQESNNCLTSKVHETRKFLKDIIDV